MPQCLPTLLKIFFLNLVLRGYAFDPRSINSGQYDYTRHCATYYMDLLHVWILLKIVKIRKDLTRGRADHCAKVTLKSLNVVIKSL